MNGRGHPIIVNAYERGRSTQQIVRPLGCDEMTLINPPSAGGDAMLTATLTVRLTVLQTAMLGASSLQLIAESYSSKTDCHRGANPAKPHQAALGAISGCWGVEVVVG